MSRESSCLLPTPSIFALGATAELKVDRFSIPLLMRFYTSGPGKARVFIDVGPSINFLKIEGKATALGTTAFVGDTTQSKAGFTIKAGARVPLSKRYAFETIAGYNLVDKHNNLDMSYFLLVSGLGVTW